MLAVIKLPEINSTMTDKIRQIRHLPEISEQKKLVDIWDNLCNTKLPEPSVINCNKQWMIGRCAFLCVRA